MEMMSIFQSLFTFMEGLYADDLFTILVVCFTFPVHFILSLNFIQESEQSIDMIERKGVTQNILHKGYNNLSHSYTCIHLIANIWCLTILCTVVKRNYLKTITRGPRWH